MHLKNLLTVCSFRYTIPINLSLSWARALQIHHLATMRVLCFKLVLAQHVREIFTDRVLTTYEIISNGYSTCLLFQ